MLTSRLLGKEDNDTCNDTATYCNQNSCGNDATEFGFLMAGRVSELKRLSMTKIRNVPPTEEKQREVETLLAARL